MKKHVKIIMIATLAISAKLAFGQTVALLTPSDISRTVNVSVSVAKKARIEVLSASNILSVSNEDKTRGYVDLPKAIVLKVWCNSIDGARVMGQIDPSINGLEGKILYRLSGEKDFRSAAGNLHNMYESYKIDRDSEVVLDIRYMLAENTPIGEYQFDASFVAEPK